MKKKLLFLILSANIFSTNILNTTQTTHNIAIIEKIPAELWIFEPQKAALAYTLELYRGITYPPSLSLNTLRKLLCCDTPSQCSHEHHPLLQSRINEHMQLVNTAINNLISAEGPLKLQNLWEASPFASGYTLNIEQLDLTTSPITTLNITYATAKNPPEYTTTLSNYSAQLSANDIISRLFTNQIHLISKSILHAVKNNELGAIDVFQSIIYPALSPTIQSILDESIMQKITTYCTKRSNRTVLNNLARLSFFKKLNLNHNRLSEFHCYFKNLDNLEVVNLHRNNMVSNNVLKKFLLNAPNIKKLDLSSCDLVDIPPKVKMLEYIEELNLNNNPKLNSEDIRTLFQYIPWVKKVDFSHCELNAFPRSIEHKEYLRDKKEQGEEITEEDDPKISQELEELIMSYNPELDVEDLDGVCKLFPNLKILDLSYCALTLEIFPNVSGLQNLEELNIEGNEDLNPLVLDTPYYNWLPSLRRLNLNNTDLHILFSTFREDAPLEELHLRENENLDIATVANVATHLTNLKKLDLSICNVQEVPEEIGSLSTLEDLSVEFNENIDKPSLNTALGNFGQLKKLNISVCNLENELDEINNMSDLEELKIFGNNSFNADTINTDETNPSIQVIDLRYCNIPETHPKIKILKEKGITVLI